MILAADAQVITNIISIVFSTVMSAVLIAVTVIIAKTNGKVQKSISVSNRLSAELPIKLKVFEIVNSYGVDLYNYFSKTWNDGSLGSLNIEDVINKLDEMTTNLSVLSTMLKVTSAKKDFIDTIENLCFESDELYVRLNKCKDTYVADLTTGHKNMSALQNIKNFIADCLINEQNYVHYAQNISSETLYFLEEYKKVYLILEEKVEPSLKEFMGNHETLFD
ncbi:MAG: hypothetical protein K2K38_01160 [Clostridia bacterium]|nr:hypothetical protein [Clostridia bacterium]